MLTYLSFLAGGVAGAFYYRERRERVALERLGAASLETLLNAIDANNPETGAHVRRVAEYALALAGAADFNERCRRKVERVALFHDVGKLDGAVSDIVTESKLLTAEELRAIRRHPTKGAEVLRPLGAFYPELPIGVLSHHERWDGNGYPRHLRGDSIPVEARIVSIADTFDAVTQTRSYSHARTLETATRIIADGRGSQFDPDLVDLFLSPPVLAEVARLLRRAHAPRKASSKRRRNSASASVPDITFRWRTPTPLLRQQGRRLP
ncbi:MAG TPA: HD domain-containing phosphohydrolase [Gemmatimonadaceae bacterium]